MIVLFLFSCNNHKEKAPEEFIKSNGDFTDTIESPPMPEYLKDKKHYIIPSVPVVSQNDINPIFLELLNGKKILKTENFTKDKYFINGFARNVYNLYYKRKIPVKAGEYKNEGNFIIYDFFYADDNQYKIACENLKNELQKLNINNNYEYYDYFDIIGDCIYFFDKKDKKITVLNTNKTNGYNILESFAKKNKDKFDEIIFASAIDTKIIK